MTDDKAASASRAAQRLLAPQRQAGTMNTNVSEQVGAKPIRQGSAFVALLPIMAAVFLAFLIIGIAMPVLSLHVHQGLGLSTFIVGLVAGSQFAASLISRPWAGRHADSLGAKHAVVTGLVVSAVAGLLCCLSLRLVGTPALSVTVL